MAMRKLSVPRLLGEVTILALLLAAGFAIGRNLTDAPVQADDPLTADSAASERTPEWYAPDLEAELAADRFQGEINGITLGVDEGPLPVCNRTELQTDTSLLVGTPFDLGLDRLPQGIVLQASPRIGVCAADGRVIWVIAQLAISPRPGVNGDSGVVQVSRWEHVRWYRQRFLADGVDAGTINGRLAVLADRGASGFGEAAVIVLDQNIDGSTMLISTNVDLDVLVELAREVYR